MKSCSSPNPVILAISWEVKQYFAIVSLKVTKNSENCHSWISRIQKMVKREITITHDSRKFWSRPITSLKYSTYLWLSSNLNSQSDTFLQWISGSLVHRFHRPHINGSHYKIISQEPQFFPWSSATFIHSKNSRFDNFGRMLVKIIETHRTDCASDSWSNSYERWNFFKNQILLLISSTFEFSCQYDMEFALKLTYQLVKIG